MKKLLLIDGNALMHRAYHAIPPLTTSAGEKVNAIFGFTSLMLRSISDLKPEYIAVAFDLAGPTFRHKLSPDYKATRQKMDQDLADQIPRLKEVVHMFGYPVFELESFEADDLIGTLTRLAYEADTNLFTYVMTADMDASQLINERVNMYTAKQKISEVTIYDADGIKAKYGGLGPDQIIDYKALRGDTSDNIPGVPGVGEKTAIELLLKYKNLDAIYSNIDILKDRTKMLLESGKESAYLSRNLATIDTHAPIQLDLGSCAVQAFDKARVTKLFQELEFSSLINRLPKQAEQAILSGLPSDVAPETTPTTYVLISTKLQLQEALAGLSEASEIAFDTETDSLDVLNCQVVGISFSNQAGAGYYVPLTSWSLQLLKDWFENAAVRKIGHNVKFDVHAMHIAGINISEPSFDTMLAAYILKEGMGKYGLKEMAFTEFGIMATPITDLIGTGKAQLTIDQVDQSVVASYAGADADHTWRLYKLFARQFEAEPTLKKLFDEIEMPTSAVLTIMEENGIRVDAPFLQQMSGEIDGQLITIEAEIYEAVGHKFNLNSPKQVGEVLFDELKLPVYKKTKTGRSTDESVLQSLKDAHPAVSHLLTYRELSKLKSTYIDALPALINPRTSRLHTSYNQAVAATGRLSSTNPNLQNIPIRTELGRKIRRAFLADPGDTLASLDYSQIELRLLAHVSKDEALRDAFLSGLDVHQATAAKVFGCDVSSVTSEQRRAAKTVNFGIMYGQSAFSLAQQIGISRAEAENFIQDYFSVYSGVKTYLQAAKEDARKLGYVETLLGRRRRIPELTSSNFQLRQAGERMAINMPIQGTAADIIKIAMIRIQAQLTSMQMNSKMLLQVHDELVFTINPQEQDGILPIIKGEMEHAITLSVPLLTECKLGKNWGEMTEIKLDAGK